MTSFKDSLGAFLVAATNPLLQFAAGMKGPGSKTAEALRARGLSLYKNHYYQPFIGKDDLRLPLDAPRDLPGLHLDAKAQLAFIESLSGRDEIAAIPDAPAGDGVFHFNNGAFDHGDADMLYAMVRHFKPARIVEVGSGQSTRVALLAAQKNREDAPNTKCAITCIEPYEQPWLEATGVEVVRNRVELMEPAFFDQLEAGDIFFIDSSHIIRPQGDVLFEILEILPRLKPGVIVQVHDIFLPYDYPEEWVLKQGLLWNEQYLLQAFLSMNAGYQILAMGSWLAKTQTEALAALLPGFARKRDARPGSIWLSRV